MNDRDWYPKGIKPYYADDYVFLIHGDCREILPHLPKVDLVLTDPPYMLPHVQFRPDMREQTRTWGNFSVAQMAFEGYLNLLWPLMNKPYEMYWFLDEISYPVLYPSLYAHSYAVKLLVWDKGRIGMGGKWRRQFELIIYLSSAPNPGRSGRPDILKEPPTEAKEHPFQKPVALITTLIEASPNAQTILDPFMGSGTTLRAAKDLGRKAIGIEIEEKYCEIAAKRMMNQMVLV
jgi:site-specific DNA-methyltransferase (adenine-specific)